MFDENRAIARYTLARDPLFVMASANKQPRVHAVVIGFGDLGEKLHDQILLTCAACSLDLPRVTVLDRPKLEHRACECYAVVRKEIERLFEYKLPLQAV